jgi:hypothetical protein
MSNIEFRMNFGVKTTEKYFCEKCDFISFKKSDWDRHTSTRKHKIRTNYADLEQKNAENVKNYTCKFCQKSYKARNSLWYHENKCEFMTKKTDNIIISDKKNLQNTNTNVLMSQQYQPQSDIQALTGLIFEMVKSNTELQKNMIEICKQGQNTSYNTSNINNNCNNKTFNLQFFLNETCKDAMNIMDFVESVKLQVTDLENVGKVGYIEGISNIIIKNLQALDVDKRPVHCTDQKREVMYVKDENTWEKEDETNKKLRKAIRVIAHKNICMLKEFRATYPDCEDYDSKKNDQYNKIVYESMGGKGDDDYDKNTKIIKKIAKVVGIEKG